MTGEVRVGAKQDDSWKTVVGIATSNSLNIYSPANDFYFATSAANLNSMGTVAIQMNDYTGVFVRAKYTSGGTLSTTPYVCVYGKRGNEWACYKDESGNRMIPLASVSSSDVVQSPWMYTDHSAKIDVLGSEVVLVQVVTAGVCNVTSAVTVQLARY